MSAIRRILVAVKNPDSRRQSGVDKAIRIARTLGASIELFHAISTPVFLEVQALTGTSVAELRRESLEKRRRRLDLLVERARALGVPASGSVEWDFPPHEAIVRHAVSTRADLIIAECHEGKRRAWLIRLTDWELLRSSPVPVLIMKNSKPWRRSRVLAAVDPSHAHAKPSGLDARIVAEGMKFTKALRGSLHLVHANYPSVIGFTVGDPGLDAATLAASYEQQKAHGRREFESFSVDQGVPRTRRHLVDRDPVEAIAAVARKVRADFVVMGAISRSGLKRLFIGDTAERVLNKLPCDVLVVKPAHFQKRVAGKSRGMRLLTPQPILPLPV